MIEQRVKTRVKNLKESLNKPIIKATVIVDLGEGPSRYSKEFYGLTPQEVKDLLDIEFHLGKSTGYTLVNLEELTTNTEWIKLVE